MSTPISLFDYHLPIEQIAQFPVEPRDSSRLLVLGRGRETLRPGSGPSGGEDVGNIEHRRFFEIVDYLRAGDVLVMNDTKVFKARLRGLVNGKEIECFLLRSREGNSEGNWFWQALIKPGRKAKIGDVIDLGGLSTMVRLKNSDGTVLLSFEIPPAEVIAFANEHGEVPVPPYVKKAPEKSDLYQTVYARETGSVAAPTAGFHFTKELLQKIKDLGVQIEFMTLHVGIGTFRPVKTETLEAHEMHSELVEIKAEVAERINQAKTEGRRIISVGTTTVRALEGVANLNKGKLPESGFVGEVNIFITPGFKFKVIDALITNFHLPKSTLIVLVSALAGRERVLAAYEAAVKEGYRFYSFGDAMFAESASSPNPFSF
ncbi:MAG: tRNA preQ1(34) S-adenosylmethionine ribosyltransferase-isomerase QueA [Candidatus Uhrbacteria bacterium]